MNDYEQLDLFASLFDKPKLPKHIRLIEFFAGIGAQAKALEILGADFEHWRTIEWSWQSITAYNAIHMGGKVEDTSNLTYEEVLKKIHGVSNDYNKPMDSKQLKAKKEKWARELLGRMLANHNYCPDVSRVHAKDLGIEDRENNLYILTYSFPCQDLSNAGLLKGMDKGSGTRSGLLWEIERILDECGDNLPQVLVMENVPGVCSSNNKAPWQSWLDCLQRKGYTSYLKILNAKDFGIPQNRQRAFLVSILGEYSYDFPRAIPLRHLLKDYIKKEVGEDYYLSEKIVRFFRENTIKQKEKGNGFKFDPKPIEECKIAKAITTRAGCRMDDNFISEEVLFIPSATSKGYMEACEGDGVIPSWKGARGVVQKGSVPTIMTSPDTIGIVVRDKEKAKKELKIRKPTEGECYRLMGFEEKDTEACKAVGQSKANIYHQAGDSIVTTVLCGIFGELIGRDYEKSINEYTDRLAKECKQKEENK